MAPCIECTAVRALEAVLQLLYPGSNMLNLVPNLITYIGRSIRGSTGYPGITTKFKLLFALILKLYGAMEGMHDTLLMTSFMRTN